MVTQDTHMETKIRRGQALNLAVQEAVHKNESDDVRKIYGYYVKYYEIISALSGHDIEDIKKMLGLK